MARFFAEKAYEPINYREISFNFGLETNTKVVGLAKPTYRSQDPTAIFKSLRDKNISIVFGLDASENFPSLAKRQGIVYLDVSIEDFTAPDVELYDAIYQTIIEEAKIGKNVAIHCHGGIGRTGTVLVALKLKEQSQMDSFYDVNSEKTYQIELPYKQGAVEVTKNVYDAIREIRQNENSHDSVEAKVQVESLCDYEQLLRTQYYKSHVKEGDNEEPPKDATP